MSNAVAIKYIAQHGTGSIATPLPAASYVNNAPLAYDNSPGDTVTGYNDTNPGGPGSGNSSVHIFYDLGATPPAITKWSCEFVYSPAGLGPGTSLYYSNDGTTWTQYDNVLFANSISRTVSSATHRYWVISAQTTSTVGNSSLTMTDARLYDGGSALIGGPPVFTRREVHTFSTGTLLTDAGDVFAILQDIALVPIRAQRKALYDCAWVSPFPVDVGFHSAGASIVATYAGIQSAALRKLLSSTGSGSNPITETIGKTVSFSGFSAILTTTDTTGLSQTWTLNNVRVPELTIPFKLDDWTMPQFTMMALPDGSDNIASVVMPW